MQVNHGASVTKFIKNLHGMVWLESEEWAGRDAVLDLLSGLVYSPHPAHPMADKLAVHSAVGGVTAAHTNLIFEMLAWRQAQFMVSSGQCRDAAHYVKELERGLYDRAKVNLV
jgi:hypothetical protein